jgi:hypothetical protein
MCKETVLLAFRCSSSLPVCYGSTTATTCKHARSWTRSSTESSRVYSLRLRCEVKRRRIKCYYFGDTLHVTCHQTKRAVSLFLGCSCPCRCHAFAPVTSDMVVGFFPLIFALYQIALLIATRLYQIALIPIDIVALIYAVLLPRKKRKVMTIAVREVVSYKCGLCLYCF